ncbi:hypothetical protein U0070_022249, partial [Myodes glareolus]
MHFETIEQCKKLQLKFVIFCCCFLQVSHSVAKLILVNFHWQVSEILDRYRANSAQLLVEARVQPNPSKHVPTAHPPHHCAVCMQFVRKENLLSLACQHQFCRSCWEQHCSVLDCPLRTPEDFVFPLLPNEELRDKYRRYLFRDYVESHYQLQLCPGADCPMVIRVQEPRARRVQCNRCNEVFCFKCRQMYHAPTDCATIRKWLTKCADDSETANYISAHTKDCPKCNICIEKNGGCNHMQCSKCKHDFCWMCLGDWKTHGSEYYECSRYKENPDIVNQSQQAQAREALKKYLFYFERWENHNKSLQLEAQTYQRIHEKIQERVMNNLGTWIDWQYLQNAAKLLAKCRYTLQYTYPYAYYMESGPRKKLFEYQQAQLEAEIENLSWKVERADSYDRGVSAFCPGAGLGKPNAHSGAAEKNPAEGFSRHLSWAVDVPGVEAVLNWPLWHCHDTGPELQLCNLNPLGAFSTAQLTGSFSAVTLTIRTAGSFASHSWWCFTCEHLTFAPSVAILCNIIRDILK